MDFTLAVKIQVTPWKNARDLTVYVVDIDVNIATYIQKHSSSNYIDDNYTSSFIFRIKVQL